MSVEQFWHWCNERHRIWLHRSRGEPYETEEVFTKFRFTNVFRELDRGTELCWSYVDRTRLKIENAIMYRVFNKPETALYCGFPISAPIVEVPSSPFTGAHMQMWGDGRWRHIQARVFSLSTLWDSVFPTMTAEEVYSELKLLPNTGVFFAHQFLQDMRHIFGGWEDWTIPGPGARRGLALLGLSEDLDGIRRLWENQQRESWLPPLELKDIQQSLCEYQKYVKLLKYHEKKCKARWFPGGPVVGLSGKYHPYKYEGMKYDVR